MSVWGTLKGSRAAEALAAQISSDEVAHAWLLLGPAGSGKRPAAQAMAAALNCTIEPGTGCGQCSVCLRIARRRFPDVHHIVRSEEHTSELQSRLHLVCRLLLEKKNEQKH